MYGTVRSQASTELHILQTYKHCTVINYLTVRW